LDGTGEIEFEGMF
jgi:hypothetical protein